MKTGILMAMIFATGVVYGDSVLAAAKTGLKTLQTKVSEYRDASNWAAITKTQAVRTLLLDEKAQVFRCYEVEVSDKLTLKKKGRKR